HDRTGRHAGGDRPFLTLLELTALVNIERDLSGRDLRSADTALDAKPAAGDIEHLACRIAADLDRLRGAGEAERNMHDVVAGRQHEGRLRRRILLEQAKHAGLIRL